MEEGLTVRNMNWTCPYCNHKTTITNANFSGTRSIAEFEPLNRTNKIAKFLDVQWLLCPNPECKKICLKASLGEGEIYHDAIKSFYTRDGGITKSWTLLPDTKGKSFPDYIPQVLRSDYEEAYAIVELSPKASATLARRCLQGMIRDFWSIKEDTLFKAINELKGKIDDDVWEAIDTVRKIGNIGAHMEKDINFIVDVDADEAKRLLKLIEMLFDEWYINREKRKQKIADVIQTGVDKENARNKKN